MYKLVVCRANLVVEVIHDQQYCFDVPNTQLESFVVRQWIVDEKHVAFERKPDVFEDVQGLVLWELTYIYGTSAGTRVVGYKIENSSQSGGTSV